MTLDELRRAAADYERPHDILCVSVCPSFKFKGGLEVTAQQGEWGKDDYIVHATYSLIHPDGWPADRAGHVIAEAVRYARLRRERPDLFD